MDQTTGAMISKLDLPAGTHGGPITYKLQANGRQYVVAAAGGHDAIGSPKGDYIIAWTLRSQPHETH